MKHANFFVAAFAAVALIGRATAQEQLPVNPVETSMVVAPSVGDLYVNQWLTPAADGSISGRAIDPNTGTGVQGAKVSIISRGQAVRSATTDADGAFVLTNVASNFYTLTAEADGVFAGFGITVLTGPPGKHLPSSVDFPVIRPTGSAVLEILRTQVSPMTSSSTFPAFSSLDPLGVSRVPARGMTVSLSPDGKFNGRFAYPGMSSDRYDMSDMTAYIIKDGRRIAQTRVARDGTFWVDGLSPGVYGLVGVGRRGFGAVGFQLVEARLAQKSSEGFVFAAQGGTATINVEVGSRSDVETSQGQGDNGDDRGAAPMGPFAGPGGFGGLGGPGGGFGGGLGGGGAGLGGGGGLLAAAGIAGIIAAIALSDDDDDGPTPIGP